MAGHTTISDVRQLKELEDENAKLNKLLVEAELDGVALNDLRPRMYGPPRC